MTSTERSAGVMELAVTPVSDESLGYTTQFHFAKFKEDDIGMKRSIEEIQPGIPNLFLDPYQPRHVLPSYSS